ncbi:MAG: efflux RND transporter periplasmic adaptor subunit [Gemmatimonadota bacterium]
MRTILMISTLLGACTGRKDQMVTQGTVEVLETDVAPNTSGRVSRIWVDEGAQVHRGDTLVTLTATTLPSDLATYEARVDRARAELTELERGSRREDIESARASLRGAESEADRATRDLERVTGLGQTHVVGQQEVDRARAVSEQAQSRREMAQATLDRVSRGPRSEEITAARARAAEAIAALAGVRATSGELILIAPSDGVVLPRYVEVGELVAAGRPAVTLADLARPWVRVYVGERDVSFVQLGETVSAHLDGRPDASYRGRVVAINHEAEFTPRVALTEEERSDLVFGVKIMLADTNHQLRAGLPMTVIFQRSDSATADSATLKESSR